jgi:tetratricopeptide (TPR) repeat protein
MYPDNPLSHRYLGLAYEQLGKHALAIAQFEKAAELSPTNSIMLGGLGHALALAGRSAEARKVLSDMKRMSQSRYVSPYYLALVHAGLGENDEALRSLDDAVAHRCDALIYLRQDPWLDGLRSSPHFVDLVNQVKFPESPNADKASGETALPREGK